MLTVSLCRAVLAVRGLLCCPEAVVQQLHGVFEQLPQNQLPGSPAKTYQHFGFEACMC